MKKIDLSKLSEFLSSRSDIVFAVVFGSSEDGNIRPGSDFDIGIYFEPQPDTDILLSVLSNVSDIIEYDLVDYTDLRNADTILAFEAIQGRFLCKNDPSKTAGYVSLVCREYEDLMVELGLPV